MIPMSIISGLLGGLIAVELIKASEKREAKKARQNPPPPPLDDFIEDPHKKQSEICALLDRLGVKYEVHRDDDPNDKLYANYYSHEEYGYAVYIDLQNPYSDDKRMGFEISDTDGITLDFDYYIRDSYYSENGFRAIMKDCEQILTNEVCIGSLCIGGVLKDFQVISRRELENIDISKRFALDMSPKGVKRLSEKYGAEIRFEFWDPKFDKTVTIERKN